MDPQKERLISYFLKANPDGLEKSNLVTLPNRRLVEINVIWYHFKYSMSYGELSNRFGITERRVRFIITGK